MSKKIPIIKIILLAIIALVVYEHLYERTSLYYRTTFALPGTLHLNRSKLILKKGENFILRVNGINHRVSYTSTDFKVAFVMPSGKVYAIRNGDATIIAKVRKRELKCRVKVISLNHENLTMKVGQRKRLRIRNYYSWRTYESSNPDVVSVGKWGKLKAHKKGNAYITVKAKGVKLICKVVVK